MDQVFRRNLRESAIVPDTLIFQDKIYDITFIDPQFIIRKYNMIFTDQNLTAVKLVGCIHPNCDPKTKTFCLPERMKNCIFSKEVDSKLYYLLKTFNLDNAYFMPWGHCKYVRRSF